MSRPAQPELDQQEEETETQPEPAAISRKKERGKYDAGHTKIPGKRQKCHNENIGKPGQRRLRKMNFLRKELSTKDYLPLCAFNATFTGSVWLPENLEPEDRVQKYREIAVCSTAGQNEPPCFINPSMPLAITVHPLLILDINGILCVRSRDQADLEKLRPSIGQIAQTPIIPRPDLFDFLRFLDANFCLAIWTSAKSKTARKLVSALVPKDIERKFLFVWAQHNCTAETATEGTVFKKDLQKVWAMYPLWNETNTVIVDDSPQKCDRPENSLHPPSLNGIGDDNADHLNVLYQKKLFCELVEFWRSNPVTRRHETSSFQDSYGRDGKPQREFLLSRSVLQSLYSPGICRS